MTKQDVVAVERRTLFKWVGASISAGFVLSPLSRAFGDPLPTFQPVLGRPRSTSISINLIATQDCSIYIEYGTSKTKFTNKTANLSASADNPVVFEIANLKPNSRYYYRIRYQASGQPSTSAFSTTGSFSTAKTSGKPFVFTVQGDTHPERLGKMYNPDLYKVTLSNIASQSPDFHILLGDDFSIDPLIQKGAATLENVDKVYKSHRTFLSILGTVASIFLVNGNHEQAAAYLLDGTDTNPAILAGKSRTKYFALPSSDSFYSADQEMIPNLGLARDYYSWTWGDALFVTLDPYWHSSLPVDNVAGVDNPNTTTNTAGTKKGSATTTNKTNGKTGNLWSIGIGDEQYAWLKKTLENSMAKYKFVFAHHVMGTGRGAVEVSTNYEWGGEDPKGQTTFAKERSNWELPIHDLMVKNQVSIFFQGHDHIFVTQQRDGLIYQAVPNPADDTFTMFNSDAYTSGIKALNSGHVRVSVSSTQAKVEYFLAARPQDSQRKNLTLAHSYIVKPKV